MKRFNSVFLALCYTLFCTAAAIAANNQARLVDLGNGIIEDNKTHLQWQHDKSKRPFSSAEDAEKYVKSLELGGHHDWRLPTLAERWDLLQAFVYKHNGNITFPRQASKYWTSQTDKGTQAIKLDITCLCRGDEEVVYKNRGYVRAVRSANP